MAFLLRNLSVLAYANGFTLWHYKSGMDDQAATSRLDYFNDAGDMLAGGDMMMVSGPQGGRMHCVVTNARGVHTIPMG